MHANIFATLNFLIYFIDAVAVVQVQKHSQLIQTCTVL